MSTDAVMSAGVDDVVYTETPRRVLIVASDPSVSEQTGWDIGFWWEELTHSYWEFTNAGYQVVIASPEGGTLRGDALSDLRDEGRRSADDLISLGFINSPDTNFIVQGPFTVHAVRDGNLITGQQQDSAAVTARLVIEALGR